MASAKTISDRYSKKYTNFPTLCRAAKYHLLAATLMFAIPHVAELPSVRWEAIRLAWSISPYRSFPLVYDREAFIRSQHAYSSGDEYGREVSGFIMLFLGIAAVHRIAFGLVLFAHAHVGWPPYWRDVNESLNISHAFVQSARAGWWLGPIVLGIWQAFGVLQSGLTYAFYYWPSQHPLILLLNVALVFWAYGIHASRAIRREVFAALGPEDTRCFTCGYLLRGNTTDCCPECASPWHRADTMRFGLRRRAPRLGARTRRACTATVVAALLLMPIWWPFALQANLSVWSGLPIRTASIRAASWRYYSIGQWRGGIPLRENSVCVIRHDGAVGVIRFYRNDVSHLMYETLFWRDESHWRTDPLPKRGGGRMPEYNGSIDLGAWQIRASADGFAPPRRVIWLSPPRHIDRVEAFLPDEFRARYPSIGALFDK